MKFRAFLTDPLLGNLGAPSYRAWHVLATIIDGDAHLLTADELALARAMTQRDRFPRTAVLEFYAGPGRRSGKTLFASRLAVYHLAQDYRPRLARGESAVVACIATDRRQAALLYNYARQAVLDSPLLAPLLVRETADTLEFAHGTTLEVHTATFRGTRGRSFACVLLDEVAFLRSEESATPDIEIVRAVRPGLATLGGMLVCLSSPYMRRGVLFDAHRKHFGNDASPALYAAGPSTLFNPTLDLGLITQAREDDPEAAASEWDGEFRSDLSAAFDAQWIDAARDVDIAERPVVLVRPDGHATTYYAFTDPAGGSGKDSWTTAIAHVEGEVVLLDAVLELRPSFSTAEASARVAEFLRLYGLVSVRGDRYAGRWPSDALAAHGIAYTESEAPKSGIYRECVPLFSAGRVRLLDHPRLLTQLRQLERRVQPGGRDRFDHPGGAHDDLANAACGALLAAARGASRPLTADDFQVEPLGVLDGLIPEQAFSGPYPL